jgi:quercetin dioxygenase-like cupin family protein
VPGTNRTDLTVELLGITLALTGKAMPNGEIRRRVRFDETLAFHHTETRVGGWQNAHFHKGLGEVQIVLAGKTVLALAQPTRQLRLYRPGETWIIPAGEVHNLYLYPGTMLATVTHGSPVADRANNGNDWYPANRDFDQWSKSLTEFDITEFTRRVLPP